MGLIFVVSGIKANPGNRHLVVTRWEWRWHLSIPGESRLFWLMPCFQKECTGLLASYKAGKTLFVGHR